MSDTYRPFSERHGYSQPKGIQLEDMDDALRNSLWNVFDKNFTDTWLGGAHRIYKHIWIKFLKKPADELNENTYVESKNQVRQYFLRGEWFEVYNLVEFVVQELPLIINHPEHPLSFATSFNHDSLREQSANLFNADAQLEHLVDAFNMMLEKEYSAFRIVNGFVTPITSKEEIESIETAANAPFAGVKEHIHQALAHLSSRDNPDYRNSITESINAVESLAKEVTGESKATLGQLVDKLPLQHQAFSKGLSNLYGFTSKLRHAQTGEKLEGIDQNLARFMLIICSAFVNYIIANIAQEPIKAG